MRTRILTILLSVIIFQAGFSQSIGDKFYADVDAFLKQHVSNGLVKYENLKDNPDLELLISTISNADISDLNAAQKQAFYINAYNLYVVHKVSEAYPVASVIDLGGFFERSKIQVAGESMTLNKLEKTHLIKAYNDARFHFVLVCGALGCPPITDFAYTPEALDSQLEEQTRKAINNEDFLKYDGSTVQLSEIFKWYAKDFGTSSDNILSFINKYREQAISSDTKIKYYTYDWTLNDANTSYGDVIEKGSNEFRYIVSSTIPKGTVELKIFNNLYSQTVGDGESGSRSSFFTTTLSSFYGLNSRFNIGINARYRKVRNNAASASPFSVFGSDDAASSRSGLTAIGPQIRYAPVPKWSNFSIQSSFVFPIGQDLAGSSTRPYIDWTGPTWWTQIFNDFTIGNKFSLFTELDVLIEDIGSGSSGHINRVSTPAILIFSYIPTNKLTIYSIGGYSPYWQDNYDYFYQYGLGTKYQFTPNFELELLYTDFTNQFLSQSQGQAETINLGIRINL